MGHYCSKCGIKSSSKYINLKLDRRHCRIHDFQNDVCKDCHYHKNNIRGGYYHRFTSFGQNY